jgi:outer membrane receptor protein involved in Fe transport
MKQLYILILLISCSVSAFAQKATVFGKVTDEYNTILVAASVQSESNGTTTDALGNYSLELEAGSYSIVCSYLGYQTVEKIITVRENQELELNIQLTEGSEILQTATITSGKFEKPLGEVTVSLEVIKPALLENTNTVQVDEVLEKVPSVTVVDGQPNIRSGSGYSYGAGSRVLLLIDDLPALQGDAGFPNWNFVPVENIAQIEVVKGAASALYGSSAMNGIINIRTAYPTKETYTKVSTFATMYSNPTDSRKKWWGDTTETPLKTGLQFAHRQKIGKLDLVLGGYYLYDQSFRKDAFTRYGRFNVNTRYRINDQLAVGLNANYQKGRTGNFILWANDTTGAYVPREGTITDNNNYRLIIDPYVTYYKGEVRHKLMGRFYNIKNDQANAVADQSIASQQIYGEYQFQRNFKEIDMVLTSGVVASYSTVNAALYGDTTYTTSNSAFYAQLDKKFFDKLNVSVGIRYERNTISSLDTSVSVLSELKPVMRFGLNYQAAKYTYFRGSFGQGYRFPTIAEKFISTRVGNALTIYPNDTLISETGWSAEIGVKQGFKVDNFKGYLDVAAFWMEYENMMEFTFGNYGGGFDGIGFASQNIGNTRVRGVDVSVAGTGKLFGLKTSALIGYTYTLPTYRNFENVDTNANSISENILKYRFQHLIKFDYETTFKQFTLGIAFLGYSHMKNVDAVFENDFILPGVRSFREENNSGTLVTNIRFSCQINDHFKAALLVNNLTNEEYSLRPALLEAPRSFSLRLDYKF